MAILTLEQLMERPVFRSERVEVPELGAELLVRDFAGADRDRVVRFLHKNKVDANAGLNNGEFMMLVLSLSLCNEDGSRLFPDEQLHVLERFSEKVIDRLYVVASRINSLGAAENDEAGRNSESSQSCDSGSDLPDISAAALPSVSSE